MRPRHWLYTIPLRLRSLFWRDQVEHDLSEELQYHIEQQIHQYVNKGLSSEEARRAAIRAMGGVEQRKEECRTMRRVNFIEHFLQDISFGLRMLTKNRGFATIAILALALGIGANSAIFSVVNAVLLRSLPFPNADRLVSLNEVTKNRQILSVSYLDLLDWQKQQTVFENLTAFMTAGAILTGRGEPARITGRYVTASFFATLGVQPNIGRAFVEDEDRPGAERVVILSHSLWQDRFGSDPKLVGQTIQLNSEPWTVIGVMPDNFNFYGRQNEDNDFFKPMGYIGDQNDMRERNSHPGITAVARLKPGVTLAQADAEMKTIASRLEQTYPQTNTNLTVVTTTLLEDYIGDFGLTLWIVLAAVGVVLLIACANVSNLLLARASARRREIAVRIALGAGNLRVIRQLLTESLLLAIAGGALGLLMARWGVYLLVRLAPRDLPRLDEVTIDWRVLGFTMLVTILTGIVFGLIPALQAVRTDLQEVLKDGGRNQSSGAHGLRNLMVVSEIAMALVLLVGAGLLFKSFWHVLKIDPGFDPQNVLTMRLRLPDAKYTNAEQVQAFHSETIRRISTLPGVQYVSINTGFPLGQGSESGYSIEDRPAPLPGQGRSTLVQSVSADYHQALGIKMLQGRYFTPQDNQKSLPVVIVDDEFARRNFAGLPLSQVIGKRIHLGGDNWREIVGVVGHVKHYGLEEAGREEVYRPWVQMNDAWIGARGRAMDLVVKTSTRPDDFIQPIKQEIQTIDRDQPIANVRTLLSIYDQSMTPRRFTLLLVGLFAVVAMLLSTMGIYGVMSYTVSQHTNEIGIRVALGAQARDVLGLIIKQGMALALLGIAVGVGGAFALTRFMKGLLFGVTAADPLTYGLIAMLLMFVALVACWIPARRAMRVDPMVALRHE